MKFIDYQQVSLLPGRNQQQILADIAQKVELSGHRIADADESRPWGGFIRLELDSAPIFIDQFFSEKSITIQDTTGAALPLSPKFLLVAPHQRLSWQRHQRRSEVWKFLSDGGAYSKSVDPDIQPIFNTKEGDLAEIEQGQCHRLISQSDSFVLVAEVWRHTDLKNLSNEDDNERLQDDYNR